MKNRIRVTASNPPMMGESMKTVTIPNIKESVTKNRLKTP
jgi:hypothetical protein